MKNELRERLIVELEMALERHDNIHDVQVLIRQLGMSLKNCKIEKYNKQYENLINYFWKTYLNR